ncbi:MAG: ABC transporter ATP-binding protein [Firmicutes bacterium]|nr:ABC transporter ATP-binding protein [Bacillota bacterium]
MSILKLKNINKTFDTKSEKVVALNDISLEVEKGDFIAIVGTSGSGKTTLLNILGLLDQKTSGDYWIEDKKIEDLTEKEIARLRNENFGFILQNYALINDYSVYDNIKIPLDYRYKKFSNHKAGRKIKDIAKNLNIGEKLKQPAKNLSGGQKQRVAIARALINDTKIILADEPTGSLDKKHTEEILEIFKELNEMGKTIILITHDEKVASICKKIVHIEDGEIVNE